MTSEAFLKEGSTLEGLPLLENRVVPEHTRVSRGCAGGVARTLGKQQSDRAPVENPARRITSYHPIGIHIGSNKMPQSAYIGGAPGDVFSAPGPNFTLPADVHECRAEVRRPLRSEAGRPAAPPPRPTASRLPCALFAVASLQLNFIKTRHGPDLEFMRHEFDRLERELVPGDGRRLPPPPSPSAAVARLPRYPSGSDRVAFFCCRSAAPPSPGSPAMATAPTIEPPRPRTASGAPCRRCSL